ncbi:MAG: FAD-dependent monooxygenase [Bacilli bacterium]|nr:FAD-dependent monooxygenase [Bacilli bacterium]
MLRVRQVKVPVMNDTSEALKKSLALKLHIDEQRIKKIDVVKQSIDARKKDEIYYVYEVDVNIDNEKQILNSFKNNNDILTSPSKEYTIECTGTKVLEYPPIIVGSGPSGLFAALNLLEHGIKPIIIERGKKVDERVKDIEKLIDENKLDEESNVQFGEGGAGTFSDGKLNTLIKDTENRCRKVFETFVECGADADILYSYKPHIGTDVLRVVIKNLRKKIEYLGGKFLFNTKMTDVIIRDGKVLGIEVNNSEVIKTNILILAIGNSARDTFEMLCKREIPMESKRFAVGVRIMHPQGLIDVSQNGEKYCDVLSPATYKLTQPIGNRGVYTFCMCPGGYIINASSEKERICVNGMSYHKRDSGYANSAIVVTVSESDYGNDVLSGLNYQRKLEDKAYKLGNGLIPVQTLKDFFNNELTITEKDDLKIQGKYQFANLNNLFDPVITDSIKKGIETFDKRIKNFKYEDAILAAVETRTSSPIRIDRNANLESSIGGLYPAGEGAGYAGGITSSAIDGLKVAESILKEYRGDTNEQND